MTEIEFHTGVSDRVGFAGRMLRKAYRKGARVLVTAAPEVLAALDRALWVDEQRDFVPHVRMPGAARAIAARTPIWLSGGVVDGAPKVCVNLGADPGADLEALARLIEIVSTDPEDVVAGRERWRAYKAQGLQIVHHDHAGRD